MRPTISYSQDQIPVKAITNGLIITKDHRYLKVLEIEPINFMLRNAEEQENIIHNFASWLKVCPTKMQIKVITHAADSNKYVETLKEYMNAETNESCVELGYHYMNLIHSVSSQDAVTRRFFLIFEYAPFSESKRLTNPRDIAYEMNHVVTKTKGYFSALGNEVLDQPDENYFLGEFLYLYYNRASHITESFGDRVERIVEDIRKIHNLRENDPLQPRITCRFRFNIACSSSL